MITILDQDINKIRNQFFKSDLNTKLVEKNQITEYSKPPWFKGSRSR